MNSLMYRFFRIIMAACILLTAAGYVSAEPSSEAKRYMEMLESQSLKTRTDAAKEISRFCFEEPLLFEAVKDQLLARYSTPTTNARQRSEISWYCKALASSGDMKYADVLKKVAEKTTSDVVRSHCSKSVGQIPAYAERNKIIREGLAENSDLSTEEQKMIAMLRSRDLEMMRTAAKTVYRNPFPGDAVTDVMSEELLSACAEARMDNYTVDTMAWMCKALGASGYPKYKSTLNQIIETTNNPKLKKNAQKGLSLL